MMPPLDNSKLASTSSGGSEQRSHEWADRGIEFVLRNRLHLLPAAALLVWAAPPWNGSRLSWAAVPAVLLAVFGLYELNRVYDLAEDAINDPTGYAHTARNIPSIRVGAIISIILGMVLSIAYGTLNGNILYFGVIAIGVGYSMPHRGMGSRVGRRFKESMVLKNSIPSVIWPVTVVLYPALQSSSFSIGRALLILIGIAISVFVIEVAWDVRDSLGDEMTGIKTLANSLGATRALAIPFVISACYAVLVVALVVASVLTARWIYPAALLPLFAGLAFVWRRALASSRSTSHALVIVNMAAIVPLGVVGRW